MHRVMVDKWGCKVNFLTAESTLKWSKFQSVGSNRGISNSISVLNKLLTQRKGFHQERSLT